MAARLLATALETTINGALRLDPVTRERLSALYGRVIAVAPSGLGLTFYLQPGPGGVRVLTDYAHAPDLVLRGDPLGLLALARGRRPTSTAVEFDGDAQLGRDMQELLASLDIDWEEALARIIGDLPAHQAGNLARSGRRWGERSVTSLLLDVSEYLKYERRLLPPAHAVRNFSDEVDRLRDDTARLEARVQRLAHRFQSR